MRVEVERFTPGDREEWDRFVADARNGVFLFHRGYVEYHAHRFTDHSLLFRSGGRLVAVVPASEHGDTLVSHGGLTFGGVVSGRRVGTALMLELFAVLRGYLRESGFARMVYKAVPHIYHDLPAEEDLYALFRADARLIRRDVSSTILMVERLPPTKGRKSSVGVAQRNGVVVERSEDFHAFMRLESEVLRRRHGVEPVHSGDEMALLARRFPENIKLFVARHEGEMTAGTVIYESRQVAHAQYIAADERGRDVCAPDAIMDYLLREYYREKRYFDFGISTEEAGRSLNEGLIRNKESYGARATVYDHYELTAAS